MGVTIGPGNTLIVSAPGPQGPAGAGGGGGVSDGDKGDITVSASGATWTIDNDAVTFAKLQNITGPALVGRQAANAGDAEAITLGSGLTIDGSKQLTITASYAQQSVTMTAGTGLTGGGDLSANRTFNVAYGSTASTACEGNDARLSDARTPTAHTHALADLTQSGATTNQVVTWNGSAWVPSSPSGTGTVTSVTGGTGLTGGVITTSGTLSVAYGSTAGTSCEGNDARLSDARTPTVHSHAASDITTGTFDIGQIPTGSTASTVCIGDDARLSDARTPTSHTHALADLTQSGATSGQVIEWNGTAWAPATPSGGGGGGGAPAQTEKYVNLEHFEFPITTPREMVLVTSSGGNVGGSFETGRVGVVNIASGTSAVANAHATWRLQNSTTPHDFSAVSAATYSTLVKGLNLGDGTTTGYVFCGIARLSGSPGSNPTNGVFFRATDGGNWYAVTRASNTETATDTGVSQSTSLWRRLTAKYTSSSCTFYVDGSLVATHTTNIPTAELNYGMSVVKTAAVTSQIRYQVDYLYIEHTYATAVVVD